MGRTIEYSAIDNPKDVIQHELYSIHHSSIQHPDFNAIRENLTEANKNACISLTDAKMLNKERHQMNKILQIGFSQLITA
jgi:hypothetical protein